MEKYSILGDKRKKSFVFTILFLFFSCLIVSGGVSADNQTVQDNQTDAVDITIINASAILDISNLDDIPLGTIPEENLMVTITVKNIGKHEAPGYKLKAYLIKDGGEDEIDTQIGSDIKDTHLAAGETRTYIKTWPLPPFLKRGQYQPKFVLDGSDYFEEIETGNNKFISDNNVTPGSLIWADGGVPVYSPAEITEPGHYVLKRDITGTKKTGAFEIKSSGVTLDGEGHKISGIPTGFTNAISINSGKALEDFTLKNIIIEDYDVGIELYKVNNAKIEGCKFINLKNMGLRLDQSQNNEITDNIFEGNGIGIGIFQSKDNLIFNNLFKNQFNAVVSEEKKNRWNVDPKPGTNIIGGNIIAGNIWLNPAGGGFSETATDYTGDGIADAPYAINSANIDLYPILSSSQTSGSAQNPPVPELNETINIPVPIEPEMNEPQVSGDTGTQNATTENEKNPGEIPDNLTDVTSRDITSEDKKPQFADISVKTVTLPDSGCTGGELAFIITLENSGDYNADSFLMLYYLSEDQKIDSKDISLGEDVVKNLPSQKDETYNKTVKIPVSTGEKKYYLGVVANPGNEIFENKKENNTGFSTNRILIRSC